MQGIELDLEIANLYVKYQNRLRGEMLETEEKRKEVLNRILDVRKKTTTPDLMKSFADEIVHEIFWIRSEKSRDVTDVLVGCVCKKCQSILKHGTTQIESERDEKRKKLRLQEKKRKKSIVLENKKKKKLKKDATKHRDQAKTPGTAQ